MKGFSLETVDAALDVVVGGLRADGSEQGFDIVGVCVKRNVLMSFLPERVSRA